MSLARKITFLFFLLLALIVFCVYTNIKPYLDEQGGFVAPQEFLQENKQEEPSNTVIDKAEEKQEEPVKTEELSKEESQLSTTVQEENNNSQEPKNLLEDEALKQQQILRRIDTDYKRSNGELMYIDLSLDAQQVQDELYTIMKNNPIKFKKGNQRLAPGNDETFDKIANILREYPKYMIEVAGHSFGSGEEKYDLSLSVLRAANVKKVMKNKYGLKNRFKARGYGDTIPLVQDDMKFTNRIEFNIIGEK